MITGTYGVLNFDITPPTGVTDVSITLSCQQTGSSVPVSGQHAVAASFPATSVQAPNIGPDASCTVVADTALASGSKCPSSQPLGITTPPSAAYAPGVGQFVPTGIDTATFSVVPPVNITNPIVTYIVTAVPTQPLGGASFSTNVTAPGTNGTLTGFQVNTHYNITVVAVYNDGSVSPTGTVPLVIFPCSPIPGCTWQDTTCEKGPSVCSKCSGANFNSTSVDGTCACDSGYQLVGNACSALPSPPPPSPPPPPCTGNVKGCKVYACANGTPVCSACDTAINYQATPNNNACDCDVNHTDLDNDPSNGCEFDKRANTGVYIYPGCDYGEGTWKRLQLPVGITKVSSANGDVSAMNIPAGFKVTLYNTADMGSENINRIFDQPLVGPKNIKCFCNGSVREIPNDGSLPGGCSAGSNQGTSYNDQVTYIKVESTLSSSR